MATSAWTIASEAAEPPSVSVTLAIDPPTFAIGDAVELSVTAVSHASTSITIFTWPTILNLVLAQRRKNFTCVDMDTNTPLRLEITKGPKRRGFNHMMGDRDEQYHYTLEPEQPLEFKAIFRAAGGNPVLPGHRYSFGVQDGEEIEWWRVGKKEEAMSKPGNYDKWEPSGKPIILSNIEPVVFTVLPPKT